MASQVSANVSFTGSVTTLALYGTSNTATTAYVPQDFSSSGLNIPAYVVSNTATVANTVQYSSMGPFAGEGSVYFSGGTGSFIYFPPSTVPQLNFSLNLATCTIEFWFFPTKPGGAQTIMSHAPFVAAAGYDWTMYIGTNNKLGFYAPAGGNPESAATVNYGAWNHAAFSFTGGTVYLALNGAITSAATAPTNTSTHVFVVGQERSATGTYTYYGYISNLRITRGQALYTTAFTPPTQSLQPIQGTTQAGTPYGTVLLLRNAPAPGRIQTTKFSGANSGQVLSFPPAAMTTYATALSSGYGQGTYVASASSEAPTRLIYLAFDKSASTFWQVSGSPYTLNNPYTGSVATVDVNGTSYGGEWLQIQKPVSTVLSSYALASDSTNAPSKWFILGSRDGTNWSLVDQQTGASSWTTGTYKTYSVNSSQSFTYYRIIINIATGSSGVQPTIYEWILNGTIESVNVTADGRVGLGVVAPTRALEVAGDVVCGGTLSAGNPLMFRNALYNGDMRIAQRGTSFTNPSSVYTLDRWYLTTYGGTGNGTVSQIQSGLANFSNALQLATTSTTSGNWFISQSLETRDVVRFQGQPVTVSFWYRIPTSFTNTFRVALYWSTATDTKIPDIGTTYNTIFENFLPSTASWTQYSASGFVPPTATALSILFITYGNIVNGAQIQITGVQLEKGSVATPFEVRPFATELALCQRYYESSYSPSTTPGTANQYQNFGVGRAISTTNVRGMIPFRTPKRVGVADNTTSSLYSYSGTLAKISVILPGLGDIGTTLSHFIQGGGYVSVNDTSASPFTVGDTYLIGWTVSTEL